MGGGKPAIKFPMSYRSAWARRRTAYMGTACLRSYGTKFSNETRMPFLQSALGHEPVHALHQRYFLRGRVWPSTQRPSTRIWRKIGGIPRSLSWMSVANTSTATRPISVGFW